MTHGMISGSEARFNLCPNLTSTTRKQILQSSPQIIFKTRFIKPRISIGTQSRPYRSRTKAVFNDLCEKSQVSESFYELLGISQSDNLPEIKRAYKQLALKYHPDVSPPERAEDYTKRFILVQEAYETLSDPNTRALYDRDLAKGFHLAFSVRKRPQYDQRCEDKGEWKSRWESQLMELKRKSENKETVKSNMSWGARMRRQQRSQSS